MMPNWIEDYFKRIGYIGTPKTDLDTLTQLHYLHIRNIAFENLNPLFKIPVSLEIEDLKEKIIYHKRGGYCYEQNLLFEEVLKTIGFKTRIITGRVIWNQPLGTVNQRTHALVLIDLEDEQWLCDTAFGAQVMTAPLKLLPSFSQSTTHEHYRIITYQESYVLQTFVQKEWRNLYIFDLQEQYYVDFIVGNWYTSTHPNSSFTKELKISIIGSKTRHAIHNHLFTTHYQNQKSVKQEIQDVGELTSILREVFYLEIPQVPQAESILEALLSKSRNID